MGGTCFRSPSSTMWLLLGALSLHLSSLAPKYTKLQTPGGDVELGPRTAHHRPEETMRAYFPTKKVSRHSNVSLKDVAERALGADQSGFEFTSSLCNLDSSLTCTESGFLPSMK